MDIKLSAKDKQEIRRMIRSELSKWMNAWESELNDAVEQDLYEKEL